LESGTAFSPISRDSALLLNNLFLAAATATVFLGTLYPLALDALNGTKISVGPPYFAVTFAPIFVALLIVLPFGPRLPWRRGDLREAAKALAPAMGIALLAAVIVLVFADAHALAGAAAFALAAWVISASVIDLARRCGPWRGNAGAALGRLKLLPASAFAVAIAHAGLGVSLMGIAGTTLWRSEALVVLAPGQTVQVGPDLLRFDGAVRSDGPNYQAIRANIAVMDGNRVVARLAPERRFYPLEQQETTDTAIRTNGVTDLYVALGDERGGGRWTIRAYYNPFAPLIWFGGIIMAFGGLAGIWARMRARRVQAAASGAVAAE
jgi:cytochrome c-type biogenesis protein CcmF